MRIINDLVAELELGTRAELFRSALRSLRWMVQKKRQESTIVAITKDGRYVEPEFDFLERFSRPSAQGGVAADKSGVSRSVDSVLPAEEAHV